MVAKAAILRISIQHLFLKLWLISAKTCSVATGQLLDQNEQKLWRSEIQDGMHSGHNENLF